MSTLRETLFDETLEQINLGDEIAINTSTFSLGSEIGISIGGTFGTNGQVLTTNGSVVYWGAGGSSSNAYVQNTDSRVLSGNLNFTGTNVYFTSGFFVGSAFSINTTTLAFLTGGIYANGSLGSAGQVLASNGSSLYWASAGGTGTVTNVASGNGLTGGPITGTGTLEIVANSGLTVNTTGIFVNPGNNQIVANSTGLWVVQSRISANNADYLGGTAAADYVKYTDSRTLSGNLTFNGIATFQSNLVVGALVANGGLGAAGQYLASNGTSTYWVTPSTGSVSQVNTGSGLTGGPVTTTGTISVVANSGLVANSTGVFVNPGNNQLIANSTGLWVDQTKIDHNTLVNYDSNRHIDHTGVSISAGSGLTGGGTIAATRTLSVVANSGLVANSTGVFVAALSGLSANSTGLYVVAGNTQLVSNVTGLWLDQTQIDHDALTNYVTNEHVDHSGVTISGGNGLTGGGDITASRTISVAGNNGIIANSTGVWVNPGTGVVVNATGVHVNATYIGTITANASLYANFASYVPANTGIVSNATGVFVNSAYIATLTANLTTYVVANTGIISNSTGVFVNSAYIATITANLANYVVANTGIVSNATGVFVNASYIGTIAANSATYLGSVVTANSTALILANTIGIYANGSIGSSGQVLTSNGTVVYWTTPTTGTVTNVASGNGLTGGPITSTGTLSVVANSGLVANSTGVFVLPGNTQLTVNATGLWLDQSTIDHNSLNNYDANKHVDHTSVSISAGSGLSGGGTIAATRTLTVLANTGIVANSTGIFVDPSYIATLTANLANYVIANTGLVSNTTGVFVNSAYIGTLTANSATYVLANTGIISNSTGVFVNSAYIGTLAANSASYLGLVTANTTALIFANTIGIYANGSFGTAGQVLSSNGSVIYWADPAVGGGGGTVTQVNTGAGLTGGSITLSGTIAVIANSGITANSTGVFVNPGNTQLTVNATGLWLDQTTIDHNALINYDANKHVDHTGVSITAGSGLSGGGTIASTRTLTVLANSGITANSTGVFVDPSYIATLSANAATYLGTVITANSTALILANTIGIFANGSAGSSGQVLTSNGSVVYWANAASGSGGMVRSSSVTTASAAQNTFFLPAGYSPGQIDVYYNGVHLSNADYTEVNSITIQIGTNANDGDIVELIGFNNVAITSVNVVTGGTNTSIIFNDSNAPNGNVNFTYNKDTITVGLGQSIYETYVTYTTTGTSTQTVDSFALATYRAAKYFYSIKDNAANNYQTGELLLLQDGTNSTITDYGTIISNTTIGGFVGSSNTTHVLLQFTPVSSNTTIKMQRTLMVI